jgi:hypothetical protein
MELKVSFGAITVLDRQLFACDIKGKLVITFVNNRINKCSNEYSYTIVCDYSFVDTFTSPDGNYETLFFHGGARQLLKDMKWNFISLLIEIELTMEGFGLISKKDDCVG